LDEKYKIDWSLVLGEGAYGKVHPARVAATGEKVALKKISKRFTNASSFTSETAALWRIYDNGGHPNISGLRDIYEDYSHFYVILDLARGGELFDHLIKYGQYSERDAARLATEIFSALAFIHNIGVCHCDLKPENILLCSGRRGGETVKIIDFGCANVDERADESPFQSSQSAKNATLSLGTRAYWAPECFGKGAKKTEAMDIWAVGVILFIMLVGAHPFDVKGIKTDSEIEQKIKRNPFPPMHLAAHLSPSARDFIRKLMEPNPDERLTAITALQHPWIRGVTPSTKLIDGSDTKLEMYQDLRNTLATGIFAALVDSEKLKDKETDVDSSADTSSLTHLLKKAFDVFDNKGKGYVTEVDIGRVMAKVTGNKLSLEDEKDLMTAVKRSSSHKSSTGLSLSDFSQLFSRLSHEHHKQGDYLYHIGDTGDAMYFINSGKVEILTKKGHLVSILRHGDFFGEGALIEERNQSKD
jgi:serine/threonine protein kinase